MTTTTVLELFGGFLAATFALWLLTSSRVAVDSIAGPPSAPSLVECSARFSSLTVALGDYLLRPRLLSSLGLLALRLAVGVMMIHHGQEKLADPQQFANTYVASLHLPFPLFFAYAAGVGELLGSWLLILGLLTPVGALAIAGTMAVAAYQHILTAGFNLNVLELVVLYLGSSFALLLLGPGRFSFDAGLISGLITGSSEGHAVAPVGDAAQP